MAEFPKFEEYKFFIEDTARFSERRQTVGNTFISINTLLLAAIAFLIKDTGLTPCMSDTVLWLALPLLVAGLLVCVWWGAIIHRYKQLIGIRMTILEEMEEAPGMKGRAGVYGIERQKLYQRDEQGKKLPSGRTNFSDLESRLPSLFIILYALYGLGLVYALIQ